MAPIARDQDEDSGHDQAGEDAAQLQRQPIVGGNTKKNEGAQRCDRDDGHPNKKAAWRRSAWTQA